MSDDGISSGVDGSGDFFMVVIVVVVVVDVGAALCLCGTVRIYHESMNGS